MKYLMAVIVVASLIRLGRCQELPPAPSSTPAYLRGDTQVHSKTAAFSAPSDKTRHPKLLLVLVGPTVLGVKHIQAGRQWQALLDGQPPTESERY